MTNRRMPLAGVVLLTGVVLSQSCGAGERLRQTADDDAPSPSSPPSVPSGQVDPPACELTCDAPAGGCVTLGHCEVTGEGPACAYSLRANGAACELPGERAGVCEAGRCVACTAAAHCADGVDCTVDTCRAGACIHEDRCEPTCDLPCPALPGGCRAAGHCELSQGEATCAFPANAPDGAACAQPTGVAGVCDAGVCVACRSPLDCDDGDPCTTDTCNAGTCEHTGTCAPTCNLDCSAPSGCLTNGHCQLWANGPWCSYYGTLPPGSPCTTAAGAPGTCHDNVCVTCATDVECDDGDPCTADACTGGACTHNGTCPTCSVGTCPATANGGCKTNGHCGASGCEYDLTANGTGCSVAGVAGTCSAGDCVAVAPPVDLVSYLPPGPPTDPWCPASGVGLPALQYLRPNPPVACDVIGAVQSAYGNCPLSDYPLMNFEATDPPAYPGGRNMYDIRLLKFRGVKSFRFRMPATPTQVTFSLTSFSWGTDLYDYRVSISDVPCELEPAGTPFNASYCDGGAYQYVTAAVGYAASPALACNNVLRPGHVYYFNVHGAGNPDDPAEDGVIDAGDRLLITVEFVHP